ncbi:MAG: hypothetical protein FWD05_11910 [Oscillospiraceae bacterium]|nr:hypothetical protein [Oscillospiraceae bacterium]
MAVVDTVPGTSAVDAVPDMAVADTAVVDMTLKMVVADDTPDAVAVRSAPQ